MFKMNRKFSCDKVNFLSHGKVKSVEIDGIFINTKNSEKNLLDKGEIYLFIKKLIESGVYEYDLIDRLEREFNRKDGYQINLCSKVDSFSKMKNQYIVSSDLLGNIPDFGTQQYYSLV